MTTARKIRPKNMKQAELLAAPGAACPCDRCAHDNPARWMDIADKDHCGSCHPPRPATGDDHPGGLTGLLAEQRRKAELAADIPAETLAAWHTAQLAWWRAKEDRQGQALDRNWPLLTGSEDARWPEYWLTMARYQYAAVTALLIETCGHVLICPNHGIDGVDDWPGDYEALSLRGLLTGGGALDWTRYCLACVPLDGEARRLAEWHLKATS